MESCHVKITSGNKNKASETKVWILYKLLWMLARFSLHSFFPFLLFHFSVYLSNSHIQFKFNSLLK